MRLIVLLLALMPLAALADTRQIVDTQILPGVTQLAERAETLHKTARQNCTPSMPLKDAYSTAFDAWVTISHLRFGPTETDDRAFALAFWPDSRGATPKALSKLISQSDPIAQTAQGYRDVSIAARGFYALEFLLYDPAFTDAGKPEYRCQLIQTMTADIALTTRAIAQDWHGSYATKLIDPSADGPYRTDQEVTQELFKALSTGLQFTSETRLGRPLGTFDKPRPLRAEARRSDRSLRHVELSLSALQSLALALASDAPELQGTLDQRFTKALEVAGRIQDPSFAGVADPASRLRVEALQSAVEAIRLTVGLDLASHLGVSAGFNALDGD
ncbi:imelysin family protein [Cognatishimia sp. MH4019]|uniref:imelysin family protein n=1 Tax=Cognatishimia sp. MH4019 TaxID=2854030 RepID=UPI001CD65F7E|nr:imelysin family protein [Cognatishimia sp. MH4019]